MMFLSLPRSNVVSGVTNISVMCHMSHISSHHNYTKHKLLPTCRTQSAWPMLGEELIIGNSTEALGRQPRVWRSDYDVVIMKPNYVHIYLFSGASQPASSYLSQNGNISKHHENEMVTSIIQIRNSCHRDIHTIKLSSKFIINKLRALIVGTEI